MMTVAALSWNAVVFLVFCWSVAQNGTESDLEYIVIVSDLGAGGKSASQNHWVLVGAWKYCS